MQVTLNYSGCCKRSFSLLLAVLSALPAVSHAIKINYAAEAGAEVSDNSTLVSTGQLNETRVTTKLSAALVEEEGPFTYNADTSLRNIQYTKDTFQDESYFRLSLSSNWQLWQRRINLQIQDYYDQRSIDALGTNTPTNSQNTNLFRLSPVMSFQVSKRNSLQLVPSWSDFYYESTLNDNQQTRLSLRWSYKMYRSFDVSLGVSRSDTDYERAFISDLQTTSTDIRFDLRRKRSSASLSLGATSVQRPGQADIDGTTVDVKWEMRLAGDSVVTLSHRNEITDTSTALLNASADPASADLDNGQLSADVLENTVSTVRYARSRNGLNFSLWASSSKLDYKINNDDRDQMTVGARWNYSLSAVDNIGFTMSTTDTDVPTINRFDKRSSNEIFYLRRHTSRLESRFTISMNQRESNLSGNDYDELVYMARLKFRTRR